MHFRHLLYLLAAASLTDVDLAQATSLPENHSARNRGANDYFGQAVAISGNTMVVGAPFEDSSASGINSNLATPTPATPDNNSATNAGAAYVYVRDTSGAWTLQAYLKANNTGAGDQFGFSVAISGDTIVVGAFAEASKTTGVGSAGGDNTATNAGAAYVFVRGGTTWRQQAYLKASNTEAGDLFGYSVAISGNSIVVGAFGEASGTTSESDNTLAQAGAAYVFTRSSGIWSQQDYLKASNPGRADLFGIAVGISEESIVVGASGEASGFLNDESSNSAANAGAAYVFTRSGSSWLQEDYLKSGNIGASDLFGRSVAIDKDSIIVGAPQEDSKSVRVDSTPNELAANAGAAYIFTREDDTWTQDAYLKGSDAAAGDTFGTAVAFDKNTAIIGANGKASKAGAVYSFTRTADVWTFAEKLVATPVGEAADNFGAAVALSGDTGVVGAFGEAGANNAFPTSGSAYIYRNLGPEVSEITVSKSPSAILESGANLEFLSLATGAEVPSAEPQTITIKNTGVIALNNIVISIVGGNSNKFATDLTGTLLNLPPNSSTTFKIRMIGNGAPIATLEIASNDANNPLIRLNLIGKVFSETLDTDSDGLSDYAEYQMRSLGFNWEIPQTSLVNTLKENANVAGLYDTNSALKIGAPVLVKNPTTDTFTLTIGIQRSSDLKSYTPFPMMDSQVLINSQGNLEFRFQSLKTQAFYRLKTN